MYSSKPTQLTNAGYNNITVKRRIYTPATTAVHVTSQGFWLKNIRRRFLINRVGEVLDDTASSCCLLVQYTPYPGTNSTISNYMEHTVCTHNKINMIVIDITLTFADGDPLEENELFYRQ